MGALGRRKPKNLEHTKKYPYSAVAPRQVEFVKKTLPLPWFHWKWDQGREGACVGFGTSMMMSIINDEHRYNPFWLWNQAKVIDEWEDTNPGDDNGTSVRAGCEVLRQQGHVRVKQGVDQSVNINEGISTYRWATSIDEMRTAIADGLPISLGIDWYENFDSPVLHPKKGWWIGEGSLGDIRGGHCVCVYGANDNKEAFKFKNSWGKDYPLCWIPYAVVETLLDDWGEAVLVTDR